MRITNDHNTKRPLVNYVQLVWGYIKGISIIQKCWKNPYLDRKNNNMNRDVRQFTQKYP